MSFPESPVPVGGLLAGKYRVDRVLGRGAMGVVVAATHVHLGQRFAVKFLLSHQASQQEVHARFLREARAAGALRTQHVARVSDFGTLDGGEPYLVMELLEGRDLSQVLGAQERLPIPEAVEYLLQVCEAIGEAHRQGIVHRDLKPANLFVTVDAGGVPCMKVLDFGVSKLAGETLKLTQEGVMMGSPLYMSPEQLLGKLDVDERSDVWALGAILFELVAGRSPFHNDTLVALQTAILLKPPASLSAYVPGIPATFEAIVLQALDKERDRRWPNVAAFVAALAPFAPPRAAAYVERVAAARGVSVEVSRPTDELTLQSARRRASEPAVDVGQAAIVATTRGATSMPASAPAKPPSRARGVAAGVGILVAASAAVGVLRWRMEPASPVPPGSAAQATAAPEGGAEIDAARTAEPAAVPGVDASATAAASATAGPAPRINKVPRTVPAAKPGPVKPKNMYED